MHIDQFIELVFHLAKEKGFEACEIYFEDGRSTEIQAFEKEIVKYSDSTKRGLNFRGIYKGKLGSAFSEVIDEDSAHLLVSRSLEAAQLIEVEDEVFLYEGSVEYPELSLYNPDLATVSPERKTAFPLHLERKALESPIVSKVSISHFGEFEKVSRIVNTRGLDVFYRTNLAYAYIGAIAKHEEKTYSHYAFSANRFFDKMVEAPIIEDAVNGLSSKFGARPVATGTYKILLDARAAGQLLMAYMSIFSAEAAQKGLSLLAGKVGETIASSAVTLVDDPHLEEGLGSVPFDGEGVATFKKEIISKGDLKTLLHNLKTANKEGVATTGNASRASYQSVIGVSSTNAYIMPGIHSVDALLIAMDEGLVITELDGLHSGTNEISGDFSLGARGYFVEQGVRQHAVDQIVVSGNFFTLLKDIQAVGNDLTFELEPIGSPSLFISGLSVAGKA